MATMHSKKIGKLMLSPSVILLLAWMIIPLSLTIYFSFLSYNLLMPGTEEFIGFMNYEYFLTDPAFFEALSNTIVMVCGILFITIVGGTGFALLLNLPFWGQGIVRVLVLAPFFVMPTVSALVWKNMFMNPENGLFAYIAKFIGLEPIDFFAEIPLLSIIIIVSWMWLPFAALIILTALQSLDTEQLDAAEMDGANWYQKFFHIIMPHLARPVTVVVLIQTIFLLSILLKY